MMFPPLLFPDSITHLELDAEQSSGTTMGLLRSLRQLQHLEVLCAMPYAHHTMKSEAWRIQRLLTFLSSLPARLRAGLTQLTIEFDPRVLPDDKGFTYAINRDCFLDNVLGCRELTETLRAFSALRLIQFRFYENDLSQYDDKWWRAETATRLQVHLRTVIDVTPW
ncbi:hypothetical protein C8Q74DRAFT_1446820, partial [Fomes fomentarius]